MNTDYKVHFHPRSSMFPSKHYEKKFKSHAGIICPHNQLIVINVPLILDESDFMGFDELETITEVITHEKIHETLLRNVGPKAHIKWDEVYKWSMLVIMNSFSNEKGLEYMADLSLEIQRAELKTLLRWKYRGGKRA